MRRASLLITAAVAGCWADFPDSRLGRDGRVDGPIWSDGATFPDGPPAPDKYHCTPGAFISCDGKQLKKCNAAGDGLTTIDCSPAACDTSLARCTQCDPAQAPTCSNSSVVACTSDGVTQTTACPLGCQGGQCCVDVDKDAYSACSGDCNDNDPLVNPKQTTFQTAPSNGSYDYNCDSTEEQQYAALVSCAMVAGVCTGSGWEGTVPACGVDGSFADCQKKGPNCDQQPAKTLKQGCR